MPESSQRPITKIQPTAHYRTSFLPQTGRIIGPVRIMLDYRNLSAQPDNKGAYNVWTSDIIGTSKQDY